MPTVTTREDDILVEIGMRRRDMATSKDEWTKAVLVAKSLGISNVRIAAACGLTETAIRLLVARVEPEPK